MSKKMSLAESLRQAVQEGEPPLSVTAPVVTAPEAAPEPAAPRASAAGSQAATRAGMKKATAVLSPDDHKRLRHLALEQDATTEALLMEAITDLFKKYGVAGAGQGRSVR